MIKTILQISAVTFGIALVSCSDENVVPKNDPVTHMQSHLGTTVPYSYEALSNGTVKFTFTNTTGHDITYGDLIREGVSYTQNGSIITDFTVAAGETYTYIDDDVLAGETYRYIFEYILEGESEYQFYFDTVETFATVPSLGTFLLTAPGYPDEPYETLTDGYTINMSGVNIQVEANDLTGSVVFYLNGKKYHDNTAKFTVFREGKADLQNGSYTLDAIAYPEKNGKGVPTDTATVVFNVNNIY
jgi:hypothetical protein